MPPLSIESDTPSHLFTSPPPTPTWGERCHYGISSLNKQCHQPLRVRVNTPIFTVFLGELSSILKDKRFSTLSVKLSPIPQGLPLFFPPFAFCLSFKFRFQIPSNEGTASLWIFSGDIVNLSPWKVCFLFIQKNWTGGPISFFDRRSVQDAH